MTSDKEILIVEDTAANVIFMSEILEEHGYAYRVARDGKDAMAAMAEHAPDLVLLDLMMPQKSGLNVYKEMKGTSTLAAVPIVMVTGVSEVTGVNIKTGEKQASKTYGDDIGRQIGAKIREWIADMTPDAIIEKPFDPAVLVTTIRDLVG